MAKVKLNYKNKKYEFEVGTTLYDIAKQLYDGEDKVLAVFLDNEMFPLSGIIKQDCIINFSTFKDPYGERIYQKGLIFVLIYACKELYGYDFKIEVCHSIDKGIQITTKRHLDEKMLNDIKNKMKEIIDKDMPITKHTVRRSEAIDYFNSIGDTAKAESYKYIISHYVSLYKLGDMYNYLYSVLPYSTGAVDKFDLHFTGEGSFILQFPTPRSEGKIPEYTYRDKIVASFDYNYEQSAKLGIYNSTDINRLIAQGNIGDIIKLTETVSSSELLLIAKTIVEKPNLKMVLVAGPTSSAKTTTSRKLAMYLKVFGLNPKPLSIDDYFKERKDTPKLPNGQYDFESVDSIDIELFNKQVKEILDGKEVEIPTFNFYKGEKEYLGKKIKLEENDILIVEGLHAVNEVMTKDIPKEKKYKIYVSPLTDLNIDNHNVVSNSDIRLLRRIVRDNRTRGYSAEKTILSWKNVRAGEEKYVFPYQNEVDCVYNSSLVYEVGVLKTFVEPLLYGIDSRSHCYEEVRRLLNFLKIFIAIPTDEIPTESLLKEFIGGSYFE